jgi:hypothetical protein
MASMAQRDAGLLPGLFCGAVVAVAGASIARSAEKAVTPEQLIGTWRGTSLCTDRAVAPACSDESVVYEFTTGSKPGTVHWAADKVVAGERGRMGEDDMAYDEAEGCWKVEITSPRDKSIKSVWRIALEGARLTGTASMLPGNRKFRKLELRKD